MPDRASSSSALAPPSASVARTLPVAKSTLAMPKRSPSIARAASKLGDSRIEVLLFEDRPRRDHADDVALHDTAPARLLALLADRHRVAGGEQAGDVGLARVRREAAQRHLVRLAAVACRERQVADARRHLGVVEEHLVEVAQPEEQDGVLMLRLDAEVLGRAARLSHALLFLREVVDEQVLAEPVGAGVERAALVDARHALDERAQARAVVEHEGVDRDARAG